MGQGARGSYHYLLVDGRDQVNNPFCSDILQTWLRCLIRSCVDMVHRFGSQFEHVWYMLQSVHPIIAVNLIRFSGRLQIAAGAKQFYLQLKSSSLDSRRDGTGQMGLQKNYRRLLNAAMKRPTDIWKGVRCTQVLVASFVQRTRVRSSRTVLQMQDP